MIPQEFLHKHIAEVKIPGKPLALFELLTLPKSIKRTVLRVFSNYPFPHSIVPKYQKVLKKGFARTFWGRLKREKAKIMNQGYVFLAIYSNGELSPMWLPKDEIDNELTTIGIHPENATDGDLAQAVITFVETAEHGFGQKA